MTCICPSIQEQIYYGYAQAASKLGDPVDLYRPLTAGEALAVENKLLTLPASFSVEGTYKKPNGYGKPLWRVLIDGTKTKVGDYLVGADATYFIASMQSLLPIQAVQCNRMVNVSCQPLDDSIGAIGYGGATADNLETILTQWPASILQGTKGEKSEVGLPGDVRIPWWAILLPAFTGVIIETSYIISDELGRRYIVSSAELTDMGWRITAQQAET